jgi:putative transcriptional regulator
MTETLRGRLLVAAPILRDPNFHRTVVLVAEHGEEGAMGLVLNRPTDTPVADALPELVAIAGEDPVYVGGPVALESVLAIAELDDPGDASELLFGTVGFVQEPDVPVLRGRVFVGYAGWGAGQLEEELEEESWLVLPAEPDYLFGDDADGLWSAVLRRQGGSYALLALMPPDPSLN